MITTRLSELKIGEKGKVVFINCDDNELKRRMLDMGITRGVEIQIKKIAPFGDPVSIELRGYELCLRKKYLNDIEVIKQ